MTNIDNFRQSFDGVRANRYKVVPGARSGLLQPTSGGALSSEIYIKAMSLPGTQIGMIPVSFQGRQIKFSGERQFGEWAITVYDSADKRIREKFEAWIDSMDSRLNHTINYNVVEDWTVHYNDAVKQGHPGGSLGPSYGFKLNNCWPVDISPIDLSYDMVDSFAEFTVTIAYDWHQDLVASESTGSQQSNG